MIPLNPQRFTCKWIHKCEQYFGSKVCLMGSWVLNNNNWNWISFSTRKIQVIGTAAFFKCDDPVSGNCIVFEIMILWIHSILTHSLYLLHRIIDFNFAFVHNNALTTDKGANIMPLIGACVIWIDDKMKSKAEQRNVLSWIIKLFVRIIKIKIIQYFEIETIIIIYHLVRSPMKINNNEVPHHHSITKWTEIDIKANQRWILIAYSRRIGFQVCFSICCFCN